MNKKSLVKIINKELTILTDIVNEFSKEGDVHPFEVDMALSKIKDIYGQLLMLKENDGSIPAQNLAELQLGTVISSKEDVPAKKSVTPMGVEPQIQPAGPIVSDFEGVVKEQPATPLITMEEVALLEPIQAELPVAEPEIVLQAPSEVAMELNPTPEVKVEPVKVSHTILEEPVLAEALSNLPSKETLDKKTAKKVDEEPITPFAVPVEIEDKPLVKEPHQNLKGVIVADRFQNLSPSLNDKLSGIIKNKDLASSIKDRPIRNLKSAIKLNDRIWFTNELFNKNKTLFEKSVDTINQSADLDEALAYLFSNFSWDQNQKSTISFLELVFRRFAN
jgi:hypothetical protein